MRIGVIVWKTWAGTGSCNCAGLHWGRVAPGPNQNLTAGGGTTCGRRNRHEGEGSGGWGWEGGVGGVGGGIQSSPVCTMQAFGLGTA